MVLFSMGHGARQANGIEQKEVSTFAEMFAAILNNLSPDYPEGAPEEIRKEIKKKGAWFACAYEGGKRSKANAQPRGFIVLDIDRIPKEKRAQLEEFCARYESLVYESFSSVPEAPRFRVVIGASRPILPDELPVVTQAVSLDLLKELGAFDPETGERLTVTGAEGESIPAVEIDSCCSQLDRIYFTPTERGAATAKISSGKLFDVDAHTAPEINEPEPIAKAKGKAKAHAKRGADPVVKAIEAKGLLIEKDAKGNYRMHCPFETEHTGYSGASECVYMPPRGAFRYGTFKCMHAHCAERPQSEFFSSLGLSNEEYKAAMDEGARRPDDFFANGVRYRTGQGGVRMTISTAQGVQPDIALCAPLEVLGRARDDEQGNWGACVRWHDADGEEHTAIFSDEDLIGNPAEVRKALARGGLRLFFSGVKAPDYLAGYIYNNPSRDLKSIRLVNRTGWYRGAYVLPDRVIGTPRNERTGEAEEVMFSSTTAPSADCSELGSVFDWTRAIAAPARYSRRLMLAICAAFAAPMCALVDSSRRESGGFHFFGRSSIGKSLCGKAAASVYGNPEQRALTWTATANALEGRAFAHNDSLMLLDEAATAATGGRRGSTADIAETVYRLSGGIEKGRMQKEGGLRNVRSWRLFFISTGEASIETLVKRSGNTADIGVGVRCIDIKADAEVSTGNGGGTLGIFDKLPSNETFKGYAAKLGKALGCYYGAVGVDWLTWLAGNREAAQDAYQEFTDALRRAVGGDLSDGQISRIFGRYALCATAGELATTRGLTGWPKGAAVDACASLFREYRAGRGGDNAELTRLLERLEDVVSDIRKFGSFIDPSRAEYGYIDFAEQPSESEEEADSEGFSTIGAPGKPKAVYLLGFVLKRLSETWSQVDIARKLGALGIVKKEGDRWQVERRVKGLSKLKLYRIDLDALEAALQACRPQ